MRKSCFTLALLILSMAQFSYAKTLTNPPKVPDRIIASGSLLSELGISVSSRASSLDLILVELSFTPGKCSPIWVRADVHDANNEFIAGFNLYAYPQNDEDEYHYSVSRKHMQSTRVVVSCRDLADDYVVLVPEPKN